MSVRHEMASPSLLTISIVMLILGSATASWPANDGAPAAAALAARVLGPAASTLFEFRRTGA